MVGDGRMSRDQVTETWVRGWWVAATDVKRTMIFVSNINLRWIRYHSHMILMLICMSYICSGWKIYIISYQRAGGGRGKVETKVWVCLNGGLVIHGRRQVKSKQTRSLVANMVGCLARVEVWPSTLKSILTPLEEQYQLPLSFFLVHPHSQYLQKVLCI